MNLTVQVPLMTESDGQVSLSSISAGGTSDSVFSHGRFMARGLYSSPLLMNIAGRLLNADGSSSSSQTVITSRVWYDTPTKFSG